MSCACPWCLTLGHLDVLDRNLLCGTHERKFNFAGKSNRVLKIYTKRTLEIFGNMRLSAKHTVVVVLELPTTKKSALTWRMDGHLDCLFSSCLALGEDGWWVRVSICSCKTTVGPYATHKTQ